MGAVATNNTVDILKKDAPIVETDINFNIAYMYIKFPSSFSSIENIYRVNVNIVEYGSTVDGEIDYDNVLDTRVVEFNPSRIIYSDNAENLPLHHIKHTLNNSWYVMNYTYMYNSGANSEGNLITYSKSSEYIINNTIPVISSSYISEYITSDVLTQLEKEGSIKIWWDSVVINEPKPHQAIKFIGDPSIKEIFKVFKMDNNGSIDTTFTNGPMNESYHNLINNILNNKDFHQAALSYYNLWLPTSGTLKLRFQHNYKTYYIIIEGNLENLAKAYFR